MAIKRGLKACSGEEKWDVFLFTIFINYFHYFLFRLWSCTSSTLAIMDDNGDKRLTKDELKYGLQDYGIDLNIREMDEIFNYFGTIFYFVFIVVFYILYFYIVIYLFF